MTWLVVNPDGGVYAHGETPGAAIEAAVLTYRPEAPAGARRAAWEYMTVSGYTLEEAIAWPLVPLSS